MPHEKHRAHSPGVLGFSIVTVSTGRYAKMKAGEEFSDESGDLAERMVLRHRHRVLGRQLISDNRRLLRVTLRTAMARREVDVVIFTGGTGVSPTDITVETIRPFFDKELQGFGEMFRMKSYQRIGSAAMLSRATAGLASGKFVFCLPGSPDGVRTALNLVMPDVPHAISLARGQQTSHRRLRR